MGKVHAYLLVSFVMSISAGFCRADTATPMPAAAAVNPGSAAAGGITKEEKDRNNRASIVIFSTAYSSNEQRLTGFNVSAIFNYYIGKLYSFEQGRDYSLTPSRIWLLGADIKYCFPGESAYIPASGIGYSIIYMWIGGFGGDTGASSSIAIKSADNKILQDTYAVLSKNVQPLDTSFHFLFHYGNFSDRLFPYLSPYITLEKDKAGHFTNDYSLGARFAVSPGFSTKLTSPFDIRLEVLIPVIKNPPYLIKTLSKTESLLDAENLIKSQRP